MSKDIVVIGGGAAGLMAAIAAARCGAVVTLLEPNERLGKKVNITGKGRCNVTNDCDRDTLLGNIPGNGRFLYSALTRFSPRDTMAFFEGLGVPLKVERGSRVFPVSDSAFDITNALERELKRLRVRWVRDRAVDIVTADGAVRAVTGEKGTYPAEAVIVATGGVSYPGTGSTGDGYRLAAAVGHTIVPPRGSLVPLESEDGDCAAMQGLSLRNVELTVLNGKNKPVFREFGEMLFTHFGVSGPLVLSASAHLRRWDKEQYRLSIDLKPALDEQKLEARLLRDIGENPNRDMSNIAAGLVHRSLVDVVLRRLGIPAVRDYLMELQRSLAREHSVIMDGRDIGTVVLPDADVKVFLCADVAVRARRRCLELEKRGTPKPYDQVLKEMEERDYQDTHREVAPLRPADDAIMIDNTDMDFEASCELLLDVIRGSVAD